MSELKGRLIRVYGNDLEKVAEAAAKMRYRGATAICVDAKLFSAEPGEYSRCDAIALTEPLERIAEAFEKNAKLRGDEPPKVIRMYDEPEAEDPPADPEAEVLAEAEQREILVATYEKRFGKKPHHRKSLETILEEIKDAEAEDKPEGAAEGEGE